MQLWVKKLTTGLYVKTHQQLTFTMYLGFSPDTKWLELYPVVTTLPPADSRGPPYNIFNVG